MYNQTVNQLQQQLIETFTKQQAQNFNSREVEQIKALLATYYRFLSPTDLENESATDLTGATIAHWQLLQSRRGEESMVRVYNPRFEEHGWQSTHTVVEVVTDDMSFLVDSLSMGLNRAGLTIFLTIHPVIRVVRAADGGIESLSDRPGAPGESTSMICFRVEKQLSHDVLHALEDMIRGVLQDVIRTNADWQPMRKRVEAIGETLDAGRLPVADDELSEIRDFLDWLENDNFTYLGYCEVDLDEKRQRLNVDRDSLMGLFRENRGGNHDPADVIPVFQNGESDFPCHLLVTKANARSSVHRPAYMDFIGIKRYDDQGVVNGLYCIVGLFALAAYSSPPRDIPLLKKKVTEVVDGAGLAASGHSGKVLQNILNTFPRDTLFQISSGELLQIALGILSLQERRRPRLFLFRDPFNRFYSCFVYLPRELYNRELRLRLQRVLMDAMDGVEVEFNTFFSESVLARVHYIIHTLPEVELTFDPQLLESQVVDAMSTWEDGLRDALLEQYGEADAARYLRRYGQAFPGGFREDFYPRTAAADVGRIERALEDGGLGLNLYRPIIESPDRVHFRLYSPDKPVPLSEAIPILENMGMSVFGERPYQIKHDEGEVWIHDFSMRYSKGVEQFSDRIYANFQDTFRKAWDQQINNDRFNQLVLDAGLDWRMVELLRAYSKYLQQLKLPYSQDYIVESLTRHPDITSMLIDLFTLRFDPTQAWDEQRQARLLQRIETLMESVASLDHDRILRSLTNLILATLRTNYFQTTVDGRNKGYISFKIDPHRVDGMPLPLPMFEIFVFSARMEGVHLRGGQVARGGLRWSDRMEDFRTEILGLMKAQTVKNTVIVPVGSKGGFIVKRPPAEEDRGALMEEVTACYRTFLRGMLDLTDNLRGGEVVPPPRLVRHDGDDPYLVIAADKGTATFSDTANAIAAEYDFWLGDAFASGGSAGYDHKKMGITAKGAWESVKRHFRELGVDIQTTDFRVLGIGDMSGDVFGNGMLLSRHIKLVAAFNHQHIFIDPDPDPEASYQERERLFRLPRSSWKDYNKELISAGGGVFLRSLKSIKLSDEMRALTGSKRDRITPAELIQALLKSPVDLLWNGGIGTYVKSAVESHADVGDKANDNLRVDGQDLRCRVVGEGGNLGVTQLGRIEFATKGGLIYNDAVDNSAGVDCSDHEVNIKILLGQILANGDMTEKQRNQLLVGMTDEVAALVLGDNYRQTQAISMVSADAPNMLYMHARFMDHLEQRGMLNRELEYLPNQKGIVDRQAKGQGLTRPEIAVIHAYSKMNYFQALVQSDIPDDPFVRPVLHDYFPRVLSERFGEEMLDHRLRREIIATALTNHIVDHIGPGVGFRVREEVGANIAGVTRAYIAASHIFDSDRIWGYIQALDNKVEARVQIEMMRMISTRLERSMIWILRNHQNDIVIGELVDYFRDGVAELAESMPKPLPSNDRLDLNRRVKKLIAAGVPRELAQAVSILTPMSPALDIVEVARQSEQEIPLVAAVYYRLGIVLDFHWLRRQIGELSAGNHWHNLAKTGLLETLGVHQRELTHQILYSTKPYKNAGRMIDQWVERNHFTLERHRQMIAELRARSSLDFAMLSVVVAGATGLKT